MDNNNNWHGQDYVSYLKGVRDACSGLLDFLENVKERYFASKDVEVEMLKKQNDLLHDLELEDLNYHGIARVGKAIRELRKNRREYKNDYLLHESIKDYAKNLKHIDSIRELVTSLDELMNKITSDSEYVINQKYNKRSSIDNIVSMKPNSNNEDDSRSEDLILLNRVLNKYAVNVDSALDEDINSHTIHIKMQLENPFTLKSGKKFLIELGSNIEKYYKPGQKNVSTKTSTSDMCLKDEYNKNTLSGQIDISIDDTILYKLQIVIREGKNNVNSQKKNKSKKGRNKKKRR